MAASNSEISISISLIGFPVSHAVVFKGDIAKVGGYLGYTGNSFDRANDLLFRHPKLQIARNVHMTVFSANIKNRAAKFLCGDQHGMDSGAERKILELPLGRNRGLIFFELRRLDNQPFCRLDIHVAEIEHQVVAARITPVRAKHRHQSAAPHFVDLLDVTASFSRAQIFTALDLVDTDFQRSGEQHFQHMADAGQQFVTEVAVIDDLSVRGNFTKRSLESDAVRTHVLQQPFPPVWTFFYDLVELRFRNSVAPAGLEKFRSADTTVAQNAGHAFRQFLAAARRALTNGDDGH